MNVDDLLMNDGEPRAFHNMMITLDDGKSYKGEWYNQI